jgi:2Fe-2S ferredoxin
LTVVGQRPYYCAVLEYWIKEMPKIIYLTPDGTRHEVEVEKGYSVMEGAINNNIEGIVAECGGACACATCHSYIDEAWLDKVAEMDDMEDSMLDAAFERKDNSRLTCQIEVSDELDGLVVHVAENEY